MEVENHPFEKKNSSSKTSIFGVPAVHFFQDVCEPIEALIPTSPELGYLAPLEAVLYLGSVSSCPVKEVHVVTG